MRRDWILVNDELKSLTEGTSTRYTSKIKSYDIADAY